ncbi:MAG: hypothetical protein E6767_19290 [Dysgonomonas sp.]|nr:hypothetical protein [Dysgonomonas sp.]
MKTVYKYKIDNIEHCQNVEIYENFKILKLSVIDGICYFWALVDTENEKMNLEIYSLFTGQQIPYSDLNYIDSYRINHLILHVFWRWTSESFIK